MSDDRVLAPFGRRRIEVTVRTELGPYVVLTASDPDGPRPRAGQFYMLSSVEGWGGGTSERPFLPRAFSVLRAPADSDALEFMLHDVGPGTRRLCRLLPGEEMAVVGPLGIPFTLPADGRRTILVGGGVGTAPLAILQDQIGGAMTVLLGFRDAWHARGAALLRDARVATEDGSAGHAGFVTDLLEDELRLGDPVRVYACGPPAMLDEVRLACTARNAPAELALESGMACGFGACFGCVVHTRDGYLRLCVDGPVIDASRLEGILGAGATKG